MTSIDGVIKHGRRQEDVKRNAVLLYTSCIASDEIPQPMTSQMQWQ